METRTKLQIYQGIIQFLLDSTNYNLKNIADFTHVSLRTIRDLHLHNTLPPSTEAELNLVNLYRIILALQPCDR